MTKGPTVAVTIGPYFLGESWRRLVSSARPDRRYVLPSQGRGDLPGCATRVTRVPGAAGQAHAKSTRLTTGPFALALSTRIAVGASEDALPRAWAQGLPRAGSVSFRSFQPGQPRVQLKSRVRQRRDSKPTAPNQTGANAAEGSQTTKSARCQPPA